MSAVVTALWALFGFIALTGYVSVAVVLTVVVRRRAMEVTCKAGERSTHGYDDHLYCTSLTSHWFGPLVGGILWPLAIVPLLILARLCRDEISLARIDRMERELGMHR